MMLLFRFGFPVFHETANRSSSQRTETEVKTVRMFVFAVERIPRRCGNFSVSHVIPGGEMCVGESENVAASRRLIFRAKRNQGKWLIIGF